MTRLLVLILVANLAALVAMCGAAPSGLGPDAAYAAAGDALKAGDADRALALLDEAADAGHWESLRRLDHAHTTGGLRTSDRFDADVLIVPEADRQPDRYSAPYAAALADAVRAGDPRATLVAAVERMGMRMAAPSRASLPEALRARYWDSVDVDSVRVLYDRLAHAALPTEALTDLARLGQALGDSTGMLRLYDRAIAQGDPGACVYKVQALHGSPDVSSAAGLADYVDRMVDCDPARFADGSSMVGTIRASARNGNARSAQILDSLATLGLFERHPTLLTDAALR